MLFNPLHAVNPNDEIVQIFQSVWLNIRQYLFEEFFQELQMGMKTDSGNLLFSLFIIFQIGNNLKRVHSSMGGISHIDNLSSQVLGQFHILILRVQHKYFAVLRRQICKKCLCGIRFTATRLSNDCHIAVDTFVVPAEKVNKYRNSVFLAQTNAALIRSVGIYKRKYRRHRTGMYGTSLSFSWVIS